MLLTPYQAKILENANKKVQREDGSIGEIPAERIIAVLLDAIEKRDVVLQDHYHFFGPAHRTAATIAKVLDLP